jgi:hypothetical protein
VPNDQTRVAHRTCYVDLLEAISTAIRNGNYRISAVEAEGENAINGCETMGNLPPAAAVPPVRPGEKVMYISVRISPQDLAISGIKSNLNLEGVEAPERRDFRNDVDAEATATLTQLDSFHRTIRQDNPVPDEMFLQLAGAGAITSASEPRPITDITIRIAIDVFHGVQQLHLSIYPS